MAVVDSIQKARERGASDDVILSEIRKQNPAKEPSFSAAISRGAKPTQILDEVIKQNQVKTAVEQPIEQPKGLAQQAKEFITGAGKSFLEGAIGTTEAIRSAGQYIQAGLTPGLTVGQLKQQQDLAGTPFAGLQKGTPESETISTMLERKTPEEKIGGYVETAAEILGPAVIGVIKLKAPTTALYKWLTAPKGKTTEQILTMTKEELLKAPQVVKDAYIKLQKAGLAKEVQATKQAVTTAYQAEKVALENEIKVLQKEMQATANKVTVATRPKAISAMAKQSTVYRDLVEKELAPHKASNVGVEEFLNFVKTRFAGDEGMINEVSAMAGKFKNIGELYNNLTKLSSTISRAAKQGGKVYTPAEKLADDGVSTMVDFLKTKGVDLTEARKFWAQYAPIRNQLVRELKPFVQTPTQTQGFANRLIKIASGKDPYNENYIKAVEDLIGPVTTEVKAALQKVTTAQKNLIAQKLAQEQTIYAQRVSALEKAGQFDQLAIELKTAISPMDRVKKILKVLGIGGGAIGAYNWLSK